MKHFQTPRCMELTSLPKASCMSCIHRVTVLIMRGRQKILQLDSTMQEARTEYAQHASLSLLTATEAEMISVKNNRKVGEGGGTPNFDLRLLNCDSVNAQMLSSIFASSKGDSLSEQAITARE